jgi:hypothetical protein
VDYSRYDRYGRVLGIVLLNSEDANLEQVEAGMAWHFKKYQREQSPSVGLLSMDRRPDDVEDGRPEGAPQPRGVGADDGEYEAGELNQRAFCAQYGPA